MTALKPPSSSEDSRWRFCLAPMMDCTDRHDRYFLRLISRGMRLYSEMLTTAAVWHGDRERLLGFSPEEHPIAVQLGGSDPQQLAQVAKICADWGYDEINLNVGCPSDRVQSGQFGACLMAQPALVAECVAAMKAEVTVPVTVKHRIGIDELDSYELLQDFAGQQIEAGVDALIIHARKAWLQGLSPKQNRDVPALDYARVYRLKQAFPETPMVLNGGLKTLREAQQCLPHCDGVMLGREPYANPWMLHGVDSMLFSQAEPLHNRHEALNRLLPYVELLLQQGQPLTRISRHVIGLFNGQPGAKRWRRFISEKACRKGAGIEVLEQAAALVLPQD